MSFLHPDDHFGEDADGQIVETLVSHTNASRTCEGGESLMDLIQKLGEAVEQLKATLPKGNPSEKQAD